MEYSKEIGAIVTILAGVAGVIMALHTYFSNKLSNNIKEYEIYKDLRELLDKDVSSQKLASMQVALSCIISRELTLDEIRWFIQTPTAFRHIKDYSAQAHYLKVSDDNSGFSLKEKFISRKTRVFETVKFLGLYTIFGVISTSILIYGHLSSLQTPLLMVLYGFGVLSLFIALIFLKQKMTFSDTARMVKLVVNQTTPEPELEIVAPLENISA